MDWTVVVPFKAAAERKSRLTTHYDASERLALSDALYRHVVGTIVEAGLSQEIILLSPVSLEPEPPVRLWLQHDVSLNVDLERIRETVASPIMVVNADLPLLAVDDLTALAQAAEDYGSAVAPDRHETGTNAVALMSDTAFAFSFGPDSLARHIGSAHGGTALVKRIGLTHDVDTLADIEAILKLKQVLPNDVARLLHVQGDKGTHAAVAAGD